MILKKPRSKHTINIVEDEDFVYINYMEKNCDTPSKRSVIIKKDLDNWLNYLSGLGWKQEKKNA